MADDFVGVPRRDWADMLAELDRVNLMAALTLALAALTLLALIRKGILSAADLNPLAAL